MAIVKIGLTGAMGCGKSAAGKIFRELGVAVLDADKLAAEVLSENPAVRRKVAEIFGADAYLPNGSANKAYIAALAFSDKSKLAALEGAIYPELWKLWRQKTDGIGAQTQKNPESPVFIVTEVPLLFEKGLEKNFDICITVFCSETTRRKRLLQRGMTPTEIGARDSFQLPPLEKVRLASVALFNESGLDFLRGQIGLTLLNLKDRWTKKS